LAAAPVYPPSGQVLLCGGATAITVAKVPQTSNETWTWDGHTWQHLHPVNSPHARFAAGLVYDPANKVLVLYGGTGGNNETWTWNGTNWKQMSPPESPPAWQYAAMTYDASRKTVLLYDGAGLCPCNAIDQTWSWDGSTWTQVTTPTDPNGTAVNPGTIAYDAATSQTVFVGTTGTWVLEAGGWRRLGGGGTAIQTSGAGYITFVITDDEARGRLLELGQNGDTWAWDGKVWTAVNPSVAPPPRAGEALAYDAIRRQVVLFGGGIVDASTGVWTARTDTWVWDGTIWKQVA